MEWNKETIQSILETSKTVEGALQKTGNHENRYLVYRMLQAVYNRQTSDEQHTESTNHNNHKGFTSADAKFLTKFAKQSKPYNNLTAKQAAWVAKRMFKYAGQIALVAKDKQGTTPVVKQQQPVVDHNQEWAKHKAEFAKKEAEQEGFAFMSGIKAMEAF